MNKLKLIIDRVPEFFLECSIVIEELYELSTKLKDASNKKVLLSNLQRKFEGLGKSVVRYHGLPIETLNDLTQQFLTFLVDHAESVSHPFQDIIKLLLDRIVIMIKQISQKKPDKLIASTELALRTFLAEGEAAINEAHLKKIIGMLSCDIPVSKITQSTSDVSIVPLESLEPTCRQLPEDPDLYRIRNELRFFYHLAKMIDARLPTSNNKTELLCSLALAMNAKLDNPVPVHQLEAAIYLHDLAMLHFPDELLCAYDKISSKEQMMLRTHPTQAFEFIDWLDGWEEAARIVYQHHECVNGNGYPEGLSDHEICDGAKILAIGDFFFSACDYNANWENGGIQKLADSILSSRDVDFSSQWIDAFAEVIADFHPFEDQMQRLITCYPSVMDTLAHAEDHTQQTELTTAGKSERDLCIFEKLAKMVDARHFHWRTRTEVLLSLAIKMNAIAGNPVDTNQLKAAVYMHDVSMMQLSDQLFYKTTRYNQQDRTILEQHVEYAQNMLLCIPGWEVAAKIVVQHHEKINGTGYPQGIQGTQICDGASILAICDAYFSITNNRAERQAKCSMNRAVAKINAAGGSHFSPLWVKIFNDTVRIYPDSKKFTLRAFLKTSRYFQTVPNRILDKLSEELTPAVYEEGDVILAQGQKNDRLYLLFSGEVGIFIDNEHIMSLRRRGDLFGEMSVIAHQAISADVVAMSQVEILSLQSGVFTSSFDHITELSFLLAFVASQILTDKLNFTSRKAKQFEETNRKLDMANQAKSNLLTTVSHELRTPLTTILGYSDIVYEHLHQDDARQAMEHVRNAATKQLRLVNDLLDSAKIESGNLSLELMNIDILAVAHETLDMLAEKAQSKGISLCHDFPDATDCAVRADGFRLQQILLNLMGNSIKFTAKGEILLQIKVLTIDSGRVTLRFAISDTGIGMNEEGISNLFQPFQQADNSITRRFGGTGLGLSITREIVRLMGGDVVVDSREGHGTTFQFDLNFVCVDATTIQKNMQQQSTSSIPRLGGQVLVAEDTEEIRYLITHLVTGTGATVHGVENGEEALNAVFSEDFDLILMDVHMPVMGGIEATENMRNLNITTPIVALTAGFSKAHHEPLTAAGFSGFLEKPIQNELFYQVLKENLPQASTLAEETPKTSDSDAHNTAYSLFLKNMTELIKALNTARQDQSISAISGIVHTMKGAGGTFGHPEITHAAREVEQVLAQEGAWQASVDALLTQVKAVIDAHANVCT